MCNRYRINEDSCNIEFKLDCSKCKAINSYRFVVNCEHNKVMGHCAHVFPLLQPYPKFFDFERTIPSRQKEVSDSSCCHVEIHCVFRNNKISTKITKYRSQCKHPFDEEHVSHVFYVSDQKDFDWTTCDCDERSDSSSSEAD